MSKDGSPFSMLNSSASRCGSIFIPQPPPSNTRGPQGPRQRTPAHPPVGQHDRRVGVVHEAARDRADELGVHMLGHRQAIGECLEGGQVKRVLAAAALPHSRRGAEESEPGQGAWGAEGAQEVRGGQR